MPAKDGDRYTLRDTGGQVTVRVETVVSERARIQGLSDRPFLARGHGMLFVFDRGALHGMWMNRMQFALDIVWLDDYMRVVHITRGCMPCGTEGCPSYSSVYPARYAIELNAGDADALGFREGLSLRVSSEV
jgi:uncharacterized membrane protein (UPF0127 family)